MFFFRKEPVMSEVGVGIYALPREFTSRRPQDIGLDDLAQLFDSDYSKDEVTRQIVLLAKRRAWWCGIELHQLLALVRKHERFGTAAVREMVNDGMLRIPGRTGRLSFLNYFSPRIVYPTIKLIELIFNHQ